MDSSWLVTEPEWTVLASIERLHRKDVVRAREGHRRPATWSLFVVTICASSTHVTLSAHGGDGATTTWVLRQRVEDVDSSDGWHLSHMS